MEANDTSPLLMFSIGVVTTLFGSYLFGCIERARLKWLPDWWRRRTERRAKDLEALVIRELDRRTTAMPFAIMALRESSAMMTSALIVALIATTLDGRTGFHLLDATTSLARVFGVIFFGAAAMRAMRRADRAWALYDAVSSSSIDVDDLLASARSTSQRGSSAGTD